ncbi:MAG: hypothetical protein CVU73_15575 [Deltaproteobacteria bacterium HGW-Deltaproteobacteria-8]|jgi:hypothetical protein|nr:MAG: hypothetical protein CVU73_15575 [Deltaproteobacteria bacterium HGW-Deltaproteobacteria-8]
MSYTTYAGPGFPPIEMRVGQAMSQTTAGMPPTPGTTAFISESTAGHVVPSPVGFVQPPPASHFHGPRNSHVAHHPMRVESRVFHGEAYQAYEAPTVWEPRQTMAPPPFLASDYVKPSTYEIPHVIFPEERPVAIPLVEANPRPSMQLTEVTNLSLNLDLSEPRSVTVQNSFSEERNLTLDNSISRNLTYSFPENRESTLNMNLSQTVNADNSVINERTVQNITEAPARVLNMVFTDAPAAAPSAVLLGGPILARVA